MRYFFSTCFILLLIFPMLLGVLDIDAPVQNRPLPPGFHLTAMKKADYYHAWRHCLQQYLSLPSFCYQLKNWCDYRVFTMTDNPQIHVGRNGWLYKKKEIDDARKKACDKISAAGRLLLDLHAANRLMEASGKRLVFGVIPNKASVYPEFTGAIAPDDKCDANFYDLLVREQKQKAVSAFIRLDQVLNAAKAAGDVPYDGSGMSITKTGAEITARHIIDKLFDKRATPSDLQDLMPHVLGKTSSWQPIDQMDNIDGQKQRLTSAIVYGGAEAGLLIPTLAAWFNRVDMIVSNTIPSVNHHENPLLYDAVIIVAPENALPDISLDLDRLCAMLAIDAMADVENMLPMGTLSAHSRLAVDYDNGMVVLRSLGADSYLKFPSLPGTSPDTLRILKIPISSSRADILTWRIDEPTIIQGSRMLKPGKNALYLPLPSGRSVALRVNPGRHAGLFELSGITLLEYGDSRKRNDMDGGDRGADCKMVPSTTEMLKEPGFGSVQTPTETAHVLPVIRLDDFENGRVFQRRQGSADIFITGTFEGDPGAIEAQVRRHQDQSPVTEWETIDKTPGSGIFMGTLSRVPQGGWYRLVVRFKNSPEVRFEGESRFGVGILIACIGQSNMKEWFHTGKELTAHSLLSLHRKTAWRTSVVEGNGAIALGNRLIARIGIPVGLLDYAVNGSGLCKEADWGKGFWADRSNNGIYKRFVQGLAAAGGAVEYVLWMQGEADAARGTISESQYRNTLQTFITEQVRSDIVNGSSHPQLPFLIVGMPKRPVGRDKPHQAVRNALETVPKHIPGCYSAAVSLDLENMGRQHLTAEAYTLLGLRTAQTILYLIGEETYYRGPEVSGAFKSADQTIDITLRHYGGNDFYPASGISGWRASDTKGPIPITNVERLNSQTLRIALSRTPEGSVRISYLYGAMPDTHKAVRDNSTMELPLIPFDTVIR